MKMSLFEFKKICQERKYKEYIFNSEDNATTSEQSRTIFIFEFNSMDIFFNPNAIVFKNNTSVLSFCNVKYVTEYTDCAFDVVCNTPHGITSYRLFAKRHNTSSNNIK